MNYRNRLPRGLGLVVCTVALSACSVLPDSTPMAVYQLPAVSLTAIGNAASLQSHARSASSLQVDTPYSQHLLDSQRILVQPPGSYQVNVYQGAQWADTSPVMVRNRITAVLRQQIAGLIVSTDSTRLQTNWRLKGELEEFQVNYDAAVPVVHIRFNATLVQSAKERAVAAQTFTVKQPANGTQLPEVVTAFGLATDQLSAELARWLMQQPLN